jgi:hypothetical protein
MLALDDRSRCLLACSGAILASIGFALIPICGRSAMNATIQPANNAAKTSFTLRPAERNLVLARVYDPFARSLPSPASRPLPPPGAAPGLKQHGHPFVRAIVAGAHPRALVEDGSIRIVRIGDPVDGSNVVEIEPDGIVLGDRRHLGFGEKTR